MTSSYDSNVTLNVQDEEMEKKATLDKVRDAYYVLKSSGDKVTVEKTVEITGGSTATVRPLLSQVVSDDQLDINLKYEWSPELRIAIKKEVIRQTELTTLCQAEELERAKKMEKEAHEEARLLEEKVGDLQQELTVFYADVEKEKQELRAALGKSEQKASELQLQVDKEKSLNLELNNQVKELIKQSNTVEKQIEQMSKAASVASALKDKLQLKVDEIKELQADLKIAGGRQASNAERIQEYKSEVKELNQRLDLERERCKTAENRNVRLETLLREPSQNDTRNNRRGKGRKASRR